MRVIIVSDTHGMDFTFREVIAKEHKIDFLIHAGDTSGSEQMIKNSVSCPVKVVLGNNDYAMGLRYEEEFDLGSHRCLLTHGHRESVYYGTDRLIYKAAERGCDIVVYGHTHVPSIEYDEDLNVRAINPGSLTYPRQAGHRPSYVVMDIDNNGEISAEIKYL